MALHAALTNGFEEWKSCRVIPRALLEMSFDGTKAELNRFGDTGIHHALFIANLFHSKEWLKDAAQFYARALSLYRTAEAAFIDDEIVRDAVEVLSELADMQDRDIAETLYGSEAERGILQLLEKRQQLADAANDEFSRSSIIEPHCSIEDAARYCFNKLVPGYWARGEAYGILVHLALFWAQAAFAYGNKELLFSANPIKTSHGPLFMETASGLPAESVSGETLPTYVPPFLDAAMSHVLQFVDNPVAAVEEAYKEPLCDITNVDEPIAHIYAVYKKCDPIGSIRRIFRFLDEDIVHAVALPGLTISEVRSLRHRLMTPEEASAFDVPKFSSDDITGVQHEDGSISITSFGQRISSKIAHITHPKDDRYSLIQERWYIDCGNKCLDVRTHDSASKPTGNVAECRTCGERGEWQQITLSVAIRLSSSVGFASRKLCFAAPEEIVVEAVMPPESKPIRVPLSAATATSERFSIDTGGYYALRHSFNHLDASVWEFCGCFLAATPEYYKSLMQPVVCDISSEAITPSTPALI